MAGWEFAIDVGGTFTDCIARTPEGELRPIKVLSSGVTKGQVEEREGTNRFVDPLRQSDPEDFWVGYEIRFLDERGETTLTARVARFHRRLGVLEADTVLPASIAAGTRYELTAGEEAPILAIRTALGLRRDQPIPDVTVRLGTTRGTNALLTRRGARTVFLTTKGFADVLRIANQDRPRLFDLDIVKPEPLFVDVVEIDERLAADGTVLRAPNEANVREQLLRVKESVVRGPWSVGNERDGQRVPHDQGRMTNDCSLAICLLHSFANPTHEQIVERIAREVGFTEVSVSSRLAPLIKIVSRGDTTVMDAYLNPILRDYVGRLRWQLQCEAGIPAGDTEKQAASPNLSLASSQTLKLMTSNGGLIDADRFVGKDSILSGPAGGVIGFSRVAQQAGFTHAIGFDMGGTSTDVARFDGEYEYEFETKKAGVRIVAPMLAIETVAAGGGSICDFDGVKLVVGPQSAGADPGPACYGRGGPLTVTDLNLWLGRIVPERFPFPLDRDAVERRLNELNAKLVDQIGLDAVAHGLSRIANANMVRAIRKISVARGYDPADYVLVCFGGAGAQHACAIAEQLGMKRILIHPLASLLSAYGIGVADVRRFGERSVLKPYSAETLAGVDALFAELEQTARAEVMAEGVRSDRIDAPIRSLDVRYRGVEATIRVTYPPDGDYAAKYEVLHRQLYGYAHTNRPLEITAARVEVVGHTAEPPHPAAPLTPREPMPDSSSCVFFGESWHTTPVFFRGHLLPGDWMNGPALISEPSSTIVVEPNWTARVLARGEVLVEAQTALKTRNSNPETRRAVKGDNVSDFELRASSFREAADPVLLEIFNNLFASIAEQMGVTLQKTSCSTNVKERLDFSCAIFDPQGNLVVNAPHIPVHLGAMSETVKRIIADNPTVLAPISECSNVGVRATVFVTNDPYRGGSHLPDVTVVTPVHDPLTGDLLFFTASRAHHAEIGGIVPGSMPPFSKNLGEEGVLIRNFKLVDGGVSREDELRRLLQSGPYPSRSVNDNMADIRAQVAANQLGVRQLLELVERYSLPIVQAYMGHIQRAAATKMRQALRSIPDGVYAHTDHLDDGSPICATITKSDDSARVDFTGTGPVLATNLNANRAIVSAAVMYVFRCLIHEDIPLNSGVMEPLEIVLPECLLNPPEHPDPAQCAAVVGGNVETSQRVVDTLFGALGVAAASQGTMNNFTFGDAAFGYYETICGGSGATPNADGADAVHTHMTNTRLTDVEVIERRYPVHIQEFSIRRGSGGAGHHRGGDGIVRKIEFLKPLNVSLLTERRGPFAPFGLNGGQPGSLGKNTLFKAGCEEPCDLGGKAQLVVEVGDVLVIETPGGGGFGA